MASNGAGAIVLPHTTTGLPVSSLEISHHVLGVDDRALRYSSTAYGSTARLLTLAATKLLAEGSLQVGVKAVFEILAALVNMNVSSAAEQPNKGAVRGEIALRSTAL